MEKESYGFTSKIFPEDYQKFKAVLALQSLQVGEWIEQKVIEEGKKLESLSQK